MKNRISCVMPTTASRWWILPLAIECWRKQTYKEGELLIVLDGPQELPDGSGRRVWDLIPNDPGINCRWLPGTRTLGAKYNDCIHLARYEWVVLWADDIWQAPTRLEAAVDLITDGIDIVADWATLTHDLRDGRTKYYVYPQREYPEEHSYHVALEYIHRPDTIDYIVSGTLMVRRSLALQWPFPDVPKGSDDGFVVSLLDKERGNAGFVQLKQPPYLWCAFTHGSNVSARVPKTDPLWKQWDEDLDETMGGALVKYQSAFARLRAVSS